MRPPPPPPTVSQKFPQRRLWNSSLIQAYNNKNESPTVTSTMCVNSTRVSFCWPIESWNWRHKPNVETPPMPPPPPPPPHTHFYVLKCLFFLWNVFVWAIREPTFSASLMWNNLHFACKAKAGSIFPFCHHWQRLSCLNLCLGLCLKTRK